MTELHRSGRYFGSPSNPDFEPLDFSFDLKLAPKSPMVFSAFAPC